MLLQKQDSCVLLIDVQEKLFPLVQQHEQLLSNCQWLLSLAKQLDVPTLISEQYPQGLGSTVAALRELLPTNEPMTKMHFSCVADDACWQRIQAVEREQFILMGIEAHVCVLQTAVDLLLADKEVYVVADAISARSELDKSLALTRMQDLGVQIISREMVLFEWAERAGTDEFKALSKTFLK
jgi:nicotinamidase-related amidase